MENYKPNSHSYKAKQQETVERKKVTKVIKGKAKVKQNGLRKFTDVFISEDAKNVKSYVIMDVLVPTIKKAIVDIFTDGVNMIFFGETRSRNKGSRLDTISYNRFYDRRDDRRAVEPARSRHSYNDIYLETKGEGEAVLDQMNALIDEYNLVTIADLYDMVGVTGNYTDHNYGWTDISDARVLRTRDGYVLDLPKARPIDR